MTTAYSDWTYYTSYCALRIKWDYTDAGDSCAVTATLQRWDRYANAAQGSVTLWMTDSGSNNASFAANGNNETKDVVSLGSHTFSKSHSAYGISATAGTSSYFACITDSGYYRIGEQMPTWYFTVPVQWNYAISYDANGGTGAPSGQTKWHGETLGLSDQTPSREGHTFNGWNTNASGTGTNYAAGANYTGNAPLDLYAKWTVNTYAVTFDANGGSFPSTAPSLTKTHGTALPLSTSVNSTYKPVRQNYKFLGWATSASATSAQYCTGSSNNQNTSYTTDAPITLYAVWELQYVPPRITNLKCFRCDADGNAADEGTRCKVSFTYVTDTTLSAANYATVTAKVGSNAATTLVASSAQKAGTNSYEGVLSDTGLDVNSTYSVAITVSDVQGGTTTSTAVLSQAFFTLDVLAEGHGLAIGKPATTAGLLDVGMDANFDGGLTLTDPASWRAALNVDTKGKITDNGNSAKEITVQYSGAGITSATYFCVWGDYAIRAMNAANMLKNVMKGKAVLYNDTTGTTGTVTLSQTAANYDHMRIYAKTNYGYVSTDVYSPNGKEFTMTAVSTDNSGTTTMYFIQQRRAISGTSITVHDDGYAYFDSSDAITVNATAYMSIVRVEAWNEA